MGKFVNLKFCQELVKPGMTIMVGGFMAVGAPEHIIDALVEAGTSDLTLISTDTATEISGVGKMVVAKQFKKIYASHIGLNRETGRQLNEGETEVILTPQGTLAEQIRCGGSGIGGFLTPTGVGTVVEEGKETMLIDGKKYILELPLKADVAFILGTKVDKAGNVFIAKTTRNFNPLMAMAGDIVVVEAREVVEIGEIDPHMVMVPGTLVDYIVDASGR